jgi:arylsulfatase A
MNALPRWSLLLLAAVCGSLPALSKPSAAAPSPARPNIVLMVADDLGYGDLGCYGAAKIATPNLDRLASQGMRATDAHASAAVCTPSRYSMLTGRHYARYRRNWVGELLIERDRPTLASTLRDQGYATGYFGKWHLGWGEADDREQRAAIDWNSPLPAGVLECGFDKYFGTPFSHNEAPFVFAEDRAVIGLEAGDPLVIPPKVQDPGPWGWGNSKGAQKAHAARPQDRIDLIVTGHARQWIKDHSARPFFTNIAFVAPHVPIAPAAEFKGKSGLGAYGDFIQQLDWCAGEILRTLEECGVADNTLVFFTSDNGAVAHDEVLAAGHFSNGILLGQKTDAWEGGHRVPFIVRWPGRVPAGTVTDRQICLSDIPATVWDALGIAPPPATAEESISQLPVLQNPDAPAVRSESMPLGIEGTVLRSGDWVFMPRRGSSGKTTAAQDRWTGIHAMGRTHSDYDASDNLKPDAPETQLYNLAQDISQTSNVVREHPELAAEFSARYEAIMKDYRTVRKKPAP